MAVITIPQRSVRTSSPIAKANVSIQERVKKTKVAKETAKKQAIYKEQIKIYESKLEEAKRAEEYKQAYNNVIKHYKKGKLWAVAGFGEGLERQIAQKLIKEGYSSNLGGKLQQEAYKKRIEAIKTIGDGDFKKGMKEYEKQKSYLKSIQSKATGVVPEAHIIDSKGNVTKSFIRQPDGSYHEFQGKNLTPELIERAKKFEENKSNQLKSGFISSDNTKELKELQKGTKQFQKEVKDKLTSTKKNSIAKELLLTRENEIEKAREEISFKNKLKEYENTLEQLKNTEQYKKDEEFRNKIKKIEESTIYLKKKGIDMNIVDLPKYSLTLADIGEKISKFGYTTYKELSEKGWGFIKFATDLATLRKFDLSNVKRDEIKEIKKYEKQNYNQAMKDLQGQTGRSMGTAYIQIGNLINLYAKEKDYQKKIVLERETNKLYNELMDLQKTPSLKIKNKSEWNRSLNEGISALSTAMIMRDLVRTGAKLSVKKIKQARVEKILKTPKDISIKIHSHQLRKLSKSQINKPEIKHILGKKHITYKEFLRIKKVLGEKNFIKGTIKGKNLKGSIVGFEDGTVITTINKKVGLFRKKGYTIQMTQQGDDVVQKVISHKNNRVLMKNSFKANNPFGATEVKDIIKSRKTSKIETKGGSIREDYHTAKGKRDIIQKRVPKSGEYKLKTKGKGGEYSTIHERRVFNPYEQGRLTEYGEVIEQTIPTKLLRGKLNIHANKKIVEKTIINEDLIRKFGIAEGKKDIGTFMRTPSGELQVRTMSKGYFEMDLTKVPSLKEKFFQNLKKNILNQLDDANQINLVKGKQGKVMIRPEITKHEIRIAKPELDISQMKLPKNFKFDLPKSISIDGLEELTTKGIISASTLKSFLENSNKLKIKVKQLNIQRSKSETKEEFNQRNRLNQKQRVSQKQKVQQEMRMNKNINQTINTFDMTPRVPRTPEPKGFYEPFPWIKKKKKKKNKGLNKMELREAEARLSRSTDPYLRITGKRKYKMDTLKLLRERYGNVFT